MEKGYSGKQQKPVYLAIKHICKIFGQTVMHSIRSAIRAFYFGQSKEIHIYDVLNRAMVNIKNKFVKPFKTPRGSNSGNAEAFESLSF